MVIIIQHQKKIVSFKGHDAIDFTISSEEFDQIITEVMELYQKRDITFVTNLFYRSIANLLIQQNHSDKDNIYVEHHHSHSFRVAELILKLTDFYMETQPEAILKLMNELEIINKKTLEFILITVALLHDCNYFIDKKNNELKAIHALKSALSAFNKIDNEFREILRKCRQNITSIEKICHEFYDAILCHNGDKIECSFDKILETPIGEISVQNISKLNELIKSTLETDMAYAFLSHCKLYTTKHTGRACQKEQHFGIRFQSANEEDHFLLYLLRLADNFDSTHLRLLPNQKTALDKLLPFAKIYMETHFKHPEQFHVGSWPWHHIFEKSSAYGVNYTEEELISLKRIISYNPDFKPFLINENNINNQFKYFIGLWLIDDIQLNNSIKEVYLNVVIDTRQMTDVIWFYANQTSLSDASHNAPEIIVCSEFYAQRICPTEFHYQVEVKK